MCITCGCGNPEPENEQPTSPSHEHTHVAPDGRVYRHVHAHEHAHSSEHSLSHTNVEPTTRQIQIERDILEKNNTFAASNRRQFEESGILALNLVSSPGSGKTSLLVRTITALHNAAKDVPLAIIEGDQQTSLDAERIRATGVRALQINTGKGCHLDAERVQQAVHALSPPEGTRLFIENVGNLVCPAAFDLGEAAKVVILSVTEGEDKPLKYPDMFRAARLMLLNKCDLLPYLQFDVAHALENARHVNPAIEIIQTSATTGEGIAEWIAWLDKEHATLKALQAQTITVLKRRIEELETQLAEARHASRAE